MGKIKYYKFLGANDDERLIKYDGENTFGFVSGRWMNEPSLLTKLNGRAPDPTLEEISEKQAMAITGIKTGNKVFYYVSIIIPITLIIVAYFVGKMAIQTYKDSKAREDLTKMSSSEIDKKILDTIIISKFETDITDQFKETETLYSLIPYGSTNESAYRGEITKINDVDTANVISVAVENAIKNNLYKETDEVIEGIHYNILITSEEINHITSVLYNGYGVNTFSDNIYSPKGDYFCRYDNNAYVCMKNNSVTKTYRASKIVKITEEDDNVYLYEAGILVKNETESKIDNKVSYELYRFFNGTDKIEDCSDSCIQLHNAYESYKINSIIYKHTFKKNSNGSYYWYSTEYNNKM